MEQILIGEITLLQEHLDLTPETFLLTDRQLLGCDDDDGDAAQIRVSLHRLQHLEAIHLGHHQIQEDHVRLFALYHLQARATVVGFENLVVAARLKDPS